MLKNPDHVTIVVRDVDAGKEFFALLGFEEAIDTIIEGEPFTSYMDVPGIKARHVTLVLKGAEPRFEIQLLNYLNQDCLPDPNIRKLNHVGFNHLCFTVDDIEQEVDRLKAAGVEFRNEILDFHSRKLVFLTGPEGITIELAQWE